MGCVQSSIANKQLKTSKELAKNLLEIFKKIDKDGNGLLSLKNINDYFEGPHKEQYSRRMFEQFDLNKDGFITKGEWLAIWQMLQRFGQNQAEVKLMLQRLDAGVLDLSNLEIDSLHNDQIIQQMISQVQQEMEVYVHQE